MPIIIPGTARTTQGNNGGITVIRDEFVRPTPERVLAAGPMFNSFFVSIPEPFAFSNGQTLTFSVNGGAEQTATFNTSDFVNQEAGTAAEVATVLTADITGATFAAVGGRVNMVASSLGLFRSSGETAARQTLTGTANFGNNETVTINGKVYTFQTVLTNVAGNVFIGASLAASCANLRAAINLDTGAGTTYAASTIIHPSVSATNTATTVVVIAKIAGPSANTIAVAESAANASWGDTTLTGGAFSPIVTLGLTRTRQIGINLDTNDNAVADIVGRVYTYIGPDIAGQPNPLRGRLSRELQNNHPPAGLLLAPTLVG